jgi:hypothetical protein
LPCAVAGSVLPEGKKSAAEGDGAGGEGEGDVDASEIGA